MEFVAPGARGRAPSGGMVYRVDDRTALRDRAHGDGVCGLTGARGGAQCGAFFCGYACSKIGIALLLLSTATMITSALVTLIV